MMMKFDLPQNENSIIKVIGVGGGGSNAVNHMYKQGIKGVDFIVCNTDQQSLDISPVPVKVVLGESLTRGRGAGSLPEVGKNAAIESIDRIKELLSDSTEMVFVTAGLGGGTGTGAAPVIAKAAKEMGILTVGIVTIPFGFEGKKRKMQADEGLEALKQNVDTLLVISNDKLREIYGNLKVTEAFGHADNILATAAKGIAEIITTTLQVNTDINDVKTVMKDSGVAIMGSAQASGEGRALRAVEQALTSPLLNDNNIAGARYVLVNIVSGEEEITMDELGEITDFIQDSAGMTADVIKGYGVDPSLGDTVNVTIIATGFNTKKDLGVVVEKGPEKKVFSLMDEPKKSVTNPVVNAIPPVALSTEMTLMVKPTEETEQQPVLKTEFSEPVVTPVFESPIEVIAETPKEEPLTFEFEVSNTTTTTTTVVEEEMFVASRPAAPVEPSVTNENIIINKTQSEEQVKRAQERFNTISKLKDLSIKIKSQSGLTELENEPAYKRRNIALDATPHSSESQVSRFTLSTEGEGEGKKVEIKPNNSFLHDNVD
jgi:cell division protein FtsZ